MKFWPGFFIVENGLIRESLIIDKTLSQNLFLVQLFPISHYLVNKFFRRLSITISCALEIPQIANHCWLVFWLDSHSNGLSIILVAFYHSNKHVCHLISLRQHSEMKNTNISWESTILSISGQWTSVLLLLPIVYPWVGQSYPLPIHGRTQFCPFPVHVKLEFHLLYVDGLGEFWLLHVRKSVQSRLLAIHGKVYWRMQSYLLLIHVIAKESQVACSCS